MQVKKQQLKPDVEQQTGSNLKKEYINAVYSHPAYLTYMWSTSWETRDWKKFSFQSQRKAMEKNVQTTTQLHSSHMLAK